MGARKGFTLAEMLVVMGIAAVLAAAAIPAISDGPLEAARNKEREIRIAAAMSDAYADAVALSVTTEKNKPSFDLERTGDIVDALNEFRESDSSEKLEVSFGGAKYKISIGGAFTSNGDEVHHVKYTFQNDSGTVSLSTWVACNASDAVLLTPSKEKA